MSSGICVISKKTFKEPELFVKNLLSTLGPKGLLAPKAIITLSDIRIVDIYYRTRESIISSNHLLIFSSTSRLA